MTEHVFRVRRYQRALHESWITLKKKRFIEIAHRRWGKDEIALTVTRDLALQRPASYWHCLPEYAQGRKALWTAVNPHTGKRRIDEAFPPEVVETRNDQEMFLRLKNGATWQIVGSDRYDSLVGAGVAGVVFSEWALANPSSWGYIRPMIEENGGWAAFISTPRGNNHCKAMFDHAQGSDKWFAEISSVTDTGAVTAEALEEALAEYRAIYGGDLGLAIFEQEYLCSFSGAQIGAYWGSEMSRAEREDRIRDVEIDHDHPVHTAWDLGKSANNPIWCFQVIGNQLRIVDFHSPDSDDLADWVEWLNARGYNGTDYVPHDIMVTEWGSKRTRYDTLKSLGRKPKRVPRVSVADGLQAGRDTINAAVFASRCGTGLDGLKSYRRDWDDERKCFRETPVKDWAEHIGSSFRYLALSWREVVAPKEREIKKTDLQYAVDDSGVIRANMSVREAVEARMKARRRAD